VLSPVCVCKSCQAKAFHLPKRLAKLLSWKTNNAKEGFSSTLLS
jgi:hypothetical protein